MSKRDQTVVVKFSYPFEWATAEGKAEVSQVTLKRPKGKHIKKLNKDINMETLLNLAAKIAVEDHVTPAFFDEMDAVDCLKVSEVVGDFLDSGLGTGGTV